MLSHSEIESFLQKGYVIRRGVLSKTDIETYRAAVDRILHKCRIEQAHEYLRYVDNEQDDIWGVNHIFHPSIRETSPRRIARASANFGCHRKPNRDKVALSSVHTISKFGTQAVSHQLAPGFSKRR